MRMHRKKLIVAAVCLLMAAAVLASGTLAWLSKSQSADTAHTSLSDFEVSGTLSFQDGVEYSGSTILVPVSFNEGEENYIGDMKYKITYTGSSPAYIRVRILEQWTDSATNEILSAGFLNYKLTNTANRVIPKPEESSVPKPSESATPSSIPAAGGGADNNTLAETGNWVDNRKNDYCYYYSVPVQPKMLVNTGAPSSILISDGTVQLTLIDQAKDAGLVSGVDASAQMGLVIEVEAVQPNRFREFWGINALPF